MDLLVEEEVLRAADLEIQVEQVDVGPQGRLRRDHGRRRHQLPVLEGAERLEVEAVDGLLPGAGPVHLVEGLVLDGEEPQPEPVGDHPPVLGEEAVPHVEHGLEHALS